MFFGLTEYICTTVSTTSIILNLRGSCLPCSPPVFPGTSNVTLTTHFWRCACRCGHAEQDPDVHAVPTQEDLLEFAKRSWRSMAFRQMLFGLFPPPHAFLKKTQPEPPQDVDQPGALDVLATVEEILGTYSAVCCCSCLASSLE